MKIKYPNQVARISLTDPGASTGVDFFDLESYLPVLEAGDAIKVKKVVFTLDVASHDIEYTVPGV